MAGGCVVSVNTGKAKATMLAQMCGRWRGLSAAGNQQSLGGERESSPYVDFRRDGGTGRFDEGLRPCSAARSFGAA